MQEFKVQVLNDKEFDSLPYRNISDSLGIADKKKGLAFVRESGLGKEFDLATISHEVNHLISNHVTDADEDGIMHKKGGALRNILPTVIGSIVNTFAPGLGTLLGGAMDIGMGICSITTSRTIR